MLNTDTILRLTAWVLLAAGLLAIFWGYFITGRSRGRRRCPKCWYDLSATNGATCPECGKTQKREKRFFKTRRARRPIALGLIALLVSYAAHVTPGVLERGWPAAIPTVVLIEISHLVSDVTWNEAYAYPQTPQQITLESSATQCCVELKKRAYESQIWPITGHWMVHRALLVDDVEYLFAIASAYGIPDDAWEVVRERTTFDSFRLRSPYPAGYPYYVQIIASVHGQWHEEWGHTTAERKLRVTVGQETIELPVFTGFATLRRYRHPYDGWYGFAPLEPGDTSVTLRASLLEATNEDETEWTEIWTGERTYPVRVVPTIDDAIEPVSSDEIDAALRRAFKLNPTSIDPRYFQLICQPMLRGADGKPFPPELPDDVSVSVRIDLLHEGRLAWTSQCSFGSTDHPTRFAQMSLAFELVEYHGDSHDVLKVPLPQGPEWTVRVTSDPEYALRDLHATRYWSGAFEVPLDDVR